MKISAIVAMSENRVIGKDQKLPWKISEDLRRFKEITLGHSMIMGRKTFDSIGRILPGRETIIISRQIDQMKRQDSNSLKFYSSIEDAIRYCQTQLRDEIFIVGGAEIYQLSMKYVDRIYLTLVHQVIEGDTFFPEFPVHEFAESSREDRLGAIPFSFIVLDRKDLPSPIV